MFRRSSSSTSPARLPRLRRLRLGVAGVRAAERVGQLASLVDLDMRSGTLTEAMVAPLAASTTLAALRVSVAPDDADPSGELLARSSITTLQVTATEFSPALVGALARGTRLRRLTMLVRPGLLDGVRAVDLAPFEALLALEDLAVMGQPVVAASWSALTRLERLRVLRHDCSDSSVLPTVRAALPDVHVVGRLPQPRQRDLRA